jgi:hypothetical protein
VKTRAALLLLAAVLVGACSGGANKTAENEVPVVVPGPVSAWSAVSVSGQSGSTEVPKQDRAQLAPLRAARALDRPGPPTDYGLDHPRAALSYRPTSTGTPPADVDIGNLNFDRHFVYVQRRGRPTVYLVPADTLRSTLAIVGIEDKPPDS